MGEGAGRGKGCGPGVASSQAKAVVVATAHESSSSLAASTRTPARQHGRARSSHTSLFEKPKWGGLMSDQRREPSAYDDIKARRTRTYVASVTSASPAPSPATFCSCGLRANPLFGFLRRQNPSSRYIDIQELKARDSDGRGHKPRWRRR